MLKIIKKVLAHRKMSQAQRHNKQQFKFAYDGLDKRGY